MTGKEDLKRFHHIGYVVSSIAESAEGLVQGLQASWDGQVIHDPLQKVHVTFLRTGADGTAVIELVEPASDDSPVTAFLKKSGGLHHLCYEVDDLDAVLANMRSRGVLLARKPMPAVAFDNRRIAWVYTRQKLLVELLEIQPSEVSQ